MLTIRNTVETTAILAVVEVATEVVTEEEMLMATPVAADMEAAVDMAVVLEEIAWAN